MGNKYYDGIIFRIPQLCMKGSFMGEQVEKYGVGIGVDPKQEIFTENIFSYYKSLDQKTFKINCNHETGKTIREYYEGCQVIKQSTEDL